MRNVHRTTACDHPGLAALVLAGALSACVTAEPAPPITRPIQPWGAELHVEGPSHELVGLEGTHLRVLGRTSPIRSEPLCTSTAENRARATASIWLEQFLTVALPAFAATHPRPTTPDEGPVCLAGRVSLAERTLAHARDVAGAASAPAGCVAWIDLELEAALADGATVGPDERAFVTWLFTGAPRPFDALAEQATARARSAVEAQSSGIGPRATRTTSEGRSL